MAPKVPSRPHQQKLEKPISSSSGSEEESDEEIKDQLSEPEEEEEDEEEDLSGETRQDEDKKVGKSKIESENVYQGNGSDLGSDSESDLDSPSKYKLQPISRASKPSSSKRTHQEEGDGSVRNHKRSKTASGCITRLWSDDDEVTVLNGMIDFKNDKGLDPNTNIGPFHDFIKGNLGADFSREQLRTKIRRLKKRFSNAMNKCESGEDPVFSKPHEDKTFELSKKIWGSVVSKNEKEKTKKGGAVKVNKVEFEEKETAKKEKTLETKGDFRTKYPCLSWSFENVRSNIPSLDMSVGGVGFVLKKLSSIGDDKAKELDEKWKQLIADEVQLAHRKLDLMKEQMEMAFPKGE